MTKWTPHSVKLFADGADLGAIQQLASDDLIRGFTTNPTLMRTAVISDYEAFAMRVLEIVGAKPVSFEVFADEPAEMMRQARIISSWGTNVYVKVPVSTTTGVSITDVVGDLTSEGVRLNVTAVMTPQQVALIAECLHPSVPSVISVFAGRIADTGRDPVPIMQECRRMLAHLPHAELLWASPRELLNILQADESGCHIITVTPDLLRKLPLIGKDLVEYSLETVQMFRQDAELSGYSL
jgi:transaldolase